LSHLILFLLRLLFDLLGEKKDRILYFYVTREPPCPSPPYFLSEFSGAGQLEGSSSKLRLSQPKNGELNGRRIEPVSPPLFLWVCLTPYYLCLCLIIQNFSNSVSFSDFLIFSLLIFKKIKNGAVKSLEPLQPPVLITLILTFRSVLFLMVSMRYVWRREQPLSSLENFNWIPYNLHLISIWSYSKIETHLYII
jgi:hypothetical protein